MDGYTHIEGNDPHTGPVAADTSDPVIVSDLRLGQTEYMQLDA
jgi:hypothetical protein